MFPFLVLNKILRESLRAPWYCEVYLFHGGWKMDMFPLEMSITVMYTTNGNPFSLTCETSPAYNQLNLYSTTSAGNCNTFILFASQTIDSIDPLLLLESVILRSKRGLHRFA